MEKYEGYRVNVVMLQDDEIQLWTDEQLEAARKSAIEFDGFEGFNVVCSGVTHTHPTQVSDGQYCLDCGKREHSFDENKILCCDYCGSANISNNPTLTADRVKDAMNNTKLMCLASSYTDDNYLAQRLYSIAKEVRDTIATELTKEDNGRR